ncbi:MAG: hypothetical protein P4L35_17085 [Ignavibacteriaceae bacterium]|nr:hypothetical protein [Ignavibacteriaceae bacterium]
MKKKIIYTNEKIGKVEVVKDFLPNPGIIQTKPFIESIKFLSMENCPNVSPMWESLQAALKELQYNKPIEKLDINTLSEKHDKRAGYGSPTILVNGKDLFDSPFPQSFNPSCRYYPIGLPNDKEIVSKLKLIIG